MVRVEAGHLSGSGGWRRTGPLEAFETLASVCTFEESDPFVGQG